ncbi:carboxyphosphonoenolpyruvate mutase [Dactylonectria macrodidyma]|uniref:Carboxyphosphonoenolpyruvate mutase n=1 Tax=Dactylonectria macrodidyma TaxID=307937 RepID=A0A9P9JCW4_9HYPO|nr:carboxyphosphonoenolpyruvate mutase [Dactylonectria macrodidyma]
MTQPQADVIPFRPAAAILRDQLADPDKLTVCPGVYDGFSARIALDAGFDCLYMTGAGTSASVLGQPDLGLVTLPEMANNAGMIASLDRQVPVIADADTGFGGSLSVARATQQYIQLNVAAMHIEDQILMKRCGHLRNKELVSLDDYLVRIRAAAAARKASGRDIVIIARTDSLQSQGVDEAIRRLKAAYNAGADVAFLEGIQTKEQCLKACKELAPMPCLLNVVSGGVTPMLSAAEARAIGFKIVIWPVLSLTHAYVAVKKAMRALKETGFVEPTPNGEGGIKDIFGVCGIEKAAAFDKVMGGSSLNGGFF